MFAQLSLILCVSALHFFIIILVLINLLHIHCSCFGRDDVTDTGLRPGQVGYNDYLKVN